MELITDLHLFSEGEKATWLKLNVWLMVFSRVSYSKVFYLMFFLQWAFVTVYLLSPSKFCGISANRV